MALIGVCLTLSVLPAILVPRHNISGDESVLYNTSLEELSVSVPENASFHATLNHQHHNQGLPQSPQQQPNNPYQGMQVTKQNYNPNNKTIILSSFFFNFFTRFVIHQ